ncbi:hypothetical protein LCGC14_1605380, partial [marine sediment metagenome]
AIDAGVKVVYGKEMIMTHQHFQWDEFRYQLAIALNIAGPTGWKCDHSLDKTRNILSKIEGIDISASIEHFASQGGVCDCEILLNCQ